MAKTKITAPVQQPGDVTGVGGLVFTDGVAHTDDPAIIQYCRKAGYGIGNSKPTAGAENDEQLDSREIHAGGPTVAGTKLRDAAVDPKPDDFLPPVNAGKADPHGPKVAAPGIHALPPAPIVPGQVIDEDDPEQRGQEKRELDAAKRTLVDGEKPADVVGASDEEFNAGPLGLSDPGSVEQGIEGAKAVRAAEKQTEKQQPADVAAAPAKAKATPAKKTTAAGKRH